VAVLVSIEPAETASSKRWSSDSVMGGVKEMVE
jgi:hypothetical protein